MSDIADFMHTTTLNRVVDMFRTGWLVPTDIDQVSLLGIGSEIYSRSDFYCDGQDIADRTLVTLRLRSHKLPNVRVAVFGLEVARSAAQRQRFYEHIGWMQLRSVHRDGRKHKGVLWPGPLPAFAVDAIDVPTPDALAQLTKRAAGECAVDFSPAVDFDGVVTRVVNRAHAPPSMPMPYVPPDMHYVYREPHYDAAAGALALAAHVMKTQSAMSAAVDAAPWLPAAPPTRLTALVPYDFDSCLWTAARDSFRDCSNLGGEHLIERTVAKMNKLTGRAYAGEAAAWFDATVTQYRGAQNYQCAGSEPAFATQMALLCMANPARLVQWAATAPANIALSAALLCGLHIGYSALPATMRGDASLREAVAYHALQSTSPMREWTSDDIHTDMPLPPMNWPAAPQGVGDVDGATETAA